MRTKRKVTDKELERMYNQLNHHVMILSSGIDECRARIRSTESIEEVRNNYEKLIALEDELSEAKRTRSSIHCLRAYTEDQE